MVVPRVRGWSLGTQLRREEIYGSSYVQSGTLGMEDSEDVKLLFLITEDDREKEKRENDLSESEELTR